jgi:hypothetical protein
MLLIIVFFSSLYRFENCFLLAKFERLYFILSMSSQLFSTNVQETPQLKLAHDFIQYTGANIFLTGKAGTGKTTFLKRLREHSPKRMIVTAPTGVAAINAGGVTLHSFFQLPFGPQVLPKTNPDSVSGRSVDINKFNREKINIIRSLDLLVIDEISMVRADLLDAVDRVLRRYKNRYKPFGGVQLLMIGDLQQLAPVVKDDDWEILKQQYETPYFFSSQALANTQFISIELQHIFRQSDERFIGVLNKIRDNRLDHDALEILNSRYLPDFDPDKNEGYITLTTHNLQANRINTLKMSAIKAPETTFTAEITGLFPEYSYPTDSVLLLKPGAQVMFVRNDVSREKRFYNGKIGTITSIEEDIVYVTCPDGEEIATEPVEWHNYTFTIDEKTEEITENLIGTFKQMPLKPAWAITIHKSQGLTFEKAVIDANAAFAHGQVYVALSRCRTLEGMVLSSPIDPRRLRTDGNIMNFMQDVENNQPDDQVLLQARQMFERTLLNDLNDFIPIQRRLDYCIKLVRENETILEGKPLDTCRETAEVFRVNVLEVSRKFATQINGLLQQNPDTESNADLQERLIKGCAWFAEKNHAIYDHFFDRFVLETDNKAVRKSIKDAVERLDDEFRFKLVCLEAVLKGFSVSAFLEARAKASIEKAPEPKKRNERTTAGTSENQHRSIRSMEEVDSVEILHPDLFQLLKQWRNQKAAESHNPVYLVLPQKTIIQIANRLPGSVSELLLIKGIGDKKVQQYGVEVLDIVADYCETNGLKLREQLF